MEAAGLRLLWNWSGVGIRFTVLSRGQMGKRYATYPKPKPSRWSVISLEVVFGMLHDTSDCPNRDPHHPVGTNQINHASDNVGTPYKLLLYHTWLDLLERRELIKRWRPSRSSLKGTAYAQEWTSRAGSPRRQLFCTS